MAGSRRLCRAMGMMLAGILTLTGAGAALGEDVVFPKLALQPTIDGKLQPEEWKASATVGAFVKIGTGLPAAQATAARAFHDGRRLYVAFDCIADPATLKADQSERDGRLWNDDCVEVFLAPNGGGEPYYHVIVNAAGAVYDAMVPDQSTGSRREWDADIHAAAARTATGYAVELSVPFGALGLDPAQKTWRIGLAREDKQTGHVSSWPANESSSLHSPSGWAILNGMEADAEVFRLAIDGIGWTAGAAADTNVVGGGLDVALTNAGDEVSAKLTVDIRGREGYFGRITREVTLTAGETKLALAAELPSDGNYTADVKIESGSGESSFSASRRAVFEVFSQPFAAKLVWPRFKNSFAAAQESDHVAVAIRDCRAHGTSPLVGKIELVDANRQPLAKQPFTLSAAGYGAAAEITLPCPALAEGTYDIVVRAEGVETSLELKKLALPPAGTSVWFDRNNNLVLNGKPVFPFGFFYKPPTEQAARAGFPFVLEYNQLSPEKDAWLEEHGFWVLGNTRFIWDQASQDKEGNLSDATRKRARNLMAEKLSRIIGWYGADEPELRNPSAANYRKAFREHQAMDPWRPVHTIHNNIPGLDLDADFIDIVGVDPYLGYLRGRAAPLIPYERIVREVTAAVVKSAGERPVWCTLECFPYGYYGANLELTRFPTVQEIRSHTYLAVIHGARGIFYWNGSAEGGTLGAKALWPALKAFGEEVTFLTPYLLAPDARSIKEGFVHATRREADGQACLLAVNLSGEEQEASLPANPGERFYALHENRELVAGEHGLRDRFAPYQARVYLTGIAPTLRLAQVLASYKETDSHVGVSGPDNLAHFWDGGRVETSSCNRWRKPVAVIDGAYGSAWMADTADKNPSCTVTFHRAAPIRRLLIVGDDKPSACAVHHGGAWEEVSLPEPRALHVSWSDTDDRWEFTPEPQGRHIEYTAWEYAIDVPLADAARIGGMRSVREFQLFSGK